MNLEDNYHISLSTMPRDNLPTSQETVVIEYLDELEDFAAYTSDQLGARDVALFFDTRWIQGVDDFDYVAAALMRLGAACQGRWTRFGYFAPEGSSRDDAYKLFVAEVTCARQFDFPPEGSPFVVVQLDALSSGDAQRAWRALQLDSAFVGQADVTVAGELRAALSRTLDWI